MKKIIHLAFLLFLLVACNTPADQTQTDVEVLSVEATSTQSASGPALAPEAALPFEINAPLIDAPSIVFIQMIDVVNGWGVTDTQIVRTNDGGVTWYNVTPPGVTETGYMAASQSEFLNPTHAWLQIADPNNYPNGGSMYRTTDGGLTWKSTTTPFSGGSISFLDPNNGWLMADLGVGAGSMPVSVFQTTDGGATWNRTYTNDPNLEGSSDTLPMSGLKYGITPVDMQTAWIHGVTYSTGTAYLFRTNDSGKTWSLVPLELSAEAQGAELSVDKLKFFSPTDGILILRITGPKIKMAVYKTSDAGNTWTAASASVPDGNFADIVSAQEIVFYGTNQFYVTTDAAATWKIIPPEIVFGESMIAMDFATTAVGWVIVSDPSGHYTLYKTENGGATWFPIIP